MQQHKLEIKEKTFSEATPLQKMAETHTTCFFTGININRVWKDDKTWFGSYLCYSCFKWVNSENAHIAARNVADTGRFLVPDFSRL
jgi:hypothetical protein